MQKARIYLLFVPKDIILQLPNVLHLFPIQPPLKKEKKKKKVFSSCLHISGPTSQQTITFKCLQIAKLKVK